MRCTNGKLYKTMPPWKADIETSAGFAIDEDHFRDIGAALKHGKRCLLSSLAVRRRVLSEYRQGVVTDIHASFQEAARRLWMYKKISSNRLFNVLRKIPRARINADFDSFYKEFWESLVSLFAHYKVITDTTNMSGDDTEIATDLVEGRYEGVGDIVCVLFFVDVSDLHGDDEDEDPKDSAFLSMFGYRPDVTGTAGGNGVAQEQDFNVYFQSITQLAQKLKAKDLVVYDLSRNFFVSFHFRKGSLFEASPHPDASINIVPGNNIQQLVPSQYALPEDLFYTKLSRGELLQRQYEAETSHKQIIYVLLDVSASMGGRKEVYASSLAVALLGRAIQNENIVYMRAFSSKPHYLQSALNPDEAADMQRLLIRTSFSGGGTDIPLALNQAVEDIVLARKLGDDLISKAEILLLTDGEDSGLTVDYKQVLDTSRVALHSCCIGNSSEVLKQISDTYLESDASKESGTKLLRGVSETG